MFCDTEFRSIYFGFIQSDNKISSRDKGYDSIQTCLDSPNTQEPLRSAGSAVLVDEASVHSLLRLDDSGEVTVDHFCMQPANKYI